MTLVQNIQKYDLRLSRSAYGVIAVLLVPAIGVANFLAGKDITLSVFYVLPIAIAAWNIGRSFALVLAFVSVVAWIGADAAGGVHYQNYFLLLWNGTIRLLLYVVVIGLINRLQFLQQDLEHRVEERTADLRREITERKNLERGMLIAAERERRTIGQDLHDGLCQQLTGTALAGQALLERLAADARPEESECRRIVEHLEEAISLARKLAKGLNPVELQADGLMEALEEFTATTTELFGVRCAFECDSPVLVHSPTTALHLYRIAQEAVSNALKHSGASEIIVRVDGLEAGVKLTVLDNGCGIPQARFIREGMGLRSMAERAKAIGAEFVIKRRFNGGTELSCTAPDAAGAVDA
jgi:signal transduction histidine kinase